VSRIEGIIPVAVGDESLLAYRSVGDRSVGLVDIETGTFTPVLQDSVSALYDGYEAVPGRFVMGARWESPGDASAYRIVVFEPATGLVRIALESDNDERLLYDGLRDGVWALLGPLAGLPSDPAEPVAFDLLDLETGRLLNSAAVLR
jgi:hypothetical protein